MNQLAKHIEALLFVAGEGMNVAKLSSALKKKKEEIETALNELSGHLRDAHALSLLRDGDMISVVTSREVSDIVADFAKEEFGGELTKSALETLAVVAYKGPARRSDIDYIRGVNSSFMLRNLLIRGLVERMRDLADARTYVYRVSRDFLKFLGLSSIAELPEYGTFTQKLEAFLKEQETEKLR